MAARQGGSIARGKRAGLFLILFAALSSLSSCAFFDLVHLTLNLDVKGTGSYHMSGGLYPFDDKYLLMVGSMDQRFVLIDVSDPASPKRLIDNDTTLGLGGGPVAFKNRVCYSVTGSRSLRIFDFTADIKAPVALPGTLIAADAYDVSVDGSTLAVVTKEGVTFYNLADPTSPTLTQSCSLTPGFVDGSVILLSGELCLIGAAEMAGAKTEIVVLSRDGSGSWGFASTVPLYKALPAGGSTPMLMRGSLLLYSSTHGYTPVDLSDPTNPVQKAEVNLSVDFTGDESSSLDTGGRYMAFGNGMLAVATWYGLCLYDASNPYYPLRLESELIEDKIDGISCIDAFAATGRYLFAGVYGNPGALYVLTW